MSYDFHILLSCLIGVVFAGLLLAASGKQSESSNPTILKAEPQATRRKAA